MPKRVSLDHKKVRKQLPFKPGDKVKFTQPFTNNEIYTEIQWVCITRDEILYKVLCGLNLKGSQLKRVAKETKNVRKER